MCCESFVVVVVVVVVLLSHESGGGVYRARGTSTHVKNRTLPVCPCGSPVAVVPHLRTEVDAVMEGRGFVRITPADVPIQRRSLQMRRDVILRQADLCCRMI